MVIYLNPEINCLPCSSFTASADERIFIEFSDCEETFKNLYPIKIPTMKIAKLALTNFKFSVKIFFANPKMFSKILDLEFSIQIFS